MEIESAAHKALRRFIETGIARGVAEPARVARMIAYLLAIDEPEELRIPPNYGAHQLTGDRAGTWSLTVTRNWRMTFRIGEAGTVIDLDPEDYH